MFKVNAFKILVMFLILLSSNTSNGAGLQINPEPHARYLHVRVNNRSMNAFSLADVIVTQGDREVKMAPIGTVIPPHAWAGLLFEQDLRGPQATIAIAGSMGRFTLTVDQNYSFLAAGDIREARWVYRLFGHPGVIVGEGEAASTTR